LHGQYYSIDSNIDIRTLTSSDINGKWFDGFKIIVIFSVNVDIIQLATMELLQITLPTRRHA
jgi:hypothetical protein